MLLVIDVGNTNIVFGIFDQDKLIDNWRISTNKNGTSDEYGMLFKQVLSCNHIKTEGIKDVIISSVVPSLLYTLPTTINRYFHIDPIVVDHDSHLGLTIKYDNPKEVGADRIVNAVAVKEKYGGPAIIIDIGTAITFCVIDAENNYQGGVIVPGISISSEALFARTAKLPRVEIVQPEAVVGKTTIQSIQAGLVYGYVGLVDSLIERIVEEMGVAMQDINIITTGGFSGLFVENSKYIKIIDRNLTLDGLKILYEMNKKDGRDPRCH